MNGILKRRFPFLTTPLRFTPSKCGAVIVACAVLHNLEQSLGDKDEDDEIEFQLPDPEQPYGVNDNAQGVAKRRAIIFDHIS